MKLMSNNETYEINNVNSHIEINNKKIDFKVEKIDDNKFRIKNSKTNLIAYGIKNKDKYLINIEGRQYTFNEVDDVFLINNKNQNKAEIMTPMPGSVVKILVSQNDNVEEGTPLIVIEAMKMETTLYSPIAGIVSDVKVTEKQQVSPEDYMILIENIENK